MEKLEKVSKILAPTDLSELSCIGVRTALEIARSRGSEIIVYHVVDIGNEWIASREDFISVCEKLARQKHILDSFLREKFVDHLKLVKVQQVVELGTPVSNIVEKAKSEGVDMIVMSTHGRSGLHHLLVIGSVSEQVVSRAPCPVLVIPTPGHKPRLEACLEAIEQ